MTKTEQTNQISDRTIRRIVLAGYISATAWTVAAILRAVSDIILSLV